MADCFRHLCRCNLQILVRIMKKDGPPSYKLVYKPLQPPLTLVTSTINHRIQPLIRQLNAILGAPSCILWLHNQPAAWLCWSLHASSESKDRGKRSLAASRSGRHSERQVPKPLETNGPVNSTPRIIIEYTDYWLVVEPYPSEKYESQLG